MKSSCNGNRHLNSAFEDEYVTQDVVKFKGAVCEDKKKMFFIGASGHIIYNLIKFGRKHIKTI